MFQCVTKGYLKRLDNKILQSKQHNGRYIRFHLVHLWAEQDQVFAGVRRAMASRDMSAYHHERRWTTSNTTKCWHSSSQLTPKSNMFLNSTKTGDPEGQYWYSGCYSSLVPMVPVGLWAGETHDGFWVVHHHCLAQVHRENPNNLGTWTGTTDWSTGVDKLWIELQYHGIRCQELKNHSRGPCTPRGSNVVPWSWYHVTRW